MNQQLLLFHFLPRHRVLLQALEAFQVLLCPAELVAEKLDLAGRRLDIERLDVLDLPDADPGLFDLEIPVRRDSRQARARFRELAGGQIAFREPVLVALQTSQFLAFFLTSSSSLTKI